MSIGRAPSQKSQSFQTGARLGRCIRQSTQRETVLPPLGGCGLVRRAPCSTSHSHSHRPRRSRARSSTTVVVAWTPPTRARVGNRVGDRQGDESKHDRWIDRSIDRYNITLLHGLHVCVCVLYKCHWPPTRMARVVEFV